MRANRTRQLFGEEGIARRPRTDALHHRLRHLRDLRDQHADLLVAQRLQLDGLDRVLALQVGEQGTQGVVGSQLVLATGAHDHNGMVLQAARQVGQQFATAAIGPLQVVERDQERRAIADNRQQFARGLPQAQLLLLWRQRRRDRIYM